jgi:hypothetical protein
MPGVLQSYIDAANRPVPAVSTARNGVCDAGEVCFYRDANKGGSVYDTDQAVPKHDQVTYLGAGNGKGATLIDSASSVWNRTTKTVRVYWKNNYVTNQSMPYQDIPAGATVNLSSALNDNNASHKFVGVSAPAPTSPPPTTTAPVPQATPGNGVCEVGEFCVYYNSKAYASQGTFYDFAGTASIASHFDYKYVAAGSGKGSTVGDNAWSAWNRTSRTIRLYWGRNYNSAGNYPYQDIPANQHVDLQANLKDNNASHKPI